MATAETAAPTTTAEPSVLEEKKASGPLVLPIVSPAADSVVDEKPALTSEQQTKYDWLLEKVKGWTEVPSTKDKAGPLTDSDKVWLTRECLIRYLRATKWHEKESEKRLLTTLTWRRDYGVDELTADYISPENETGKQILLGFDKQQRPVHYLRPGQQNTDVSPRQVQHLVFMVERVIELMPARQDTLCLLVNMQKSKNRSNTAPGIGQAREVLNILQTHYPERLGRALVVNVPWVVQGFFKLIHPFIDPMTREKLKFNEDLSQYVPKEQLMKDYEGGELEFEYDHASYWPALTELCNKKRAEHKQRWEAGGKQIGETEDYLKGFAAQGVGAATIVAAATVVAAAETQTTIEAAP